jgi:coenzyme F420 hydrogenase subunit beta
VTSEMPLTPAVAGADGNDIFDTVVSGGYCIGCGNCAAMSGGAIEMAFDGEGFLQPRIADAVDGSKFAPACPFSNLIPDESELADEQLWGDIPHNDELGRHGALYAGHVVDEAFRLGGGSGGMTTWFLRELLASGEVDHVLHVKPVDPFADPQGRMFRYAVSSDADGLMEGRKSRYYPVDLSEVYETILSRPGRYAVVGVPCFAKSIRLMQRASPEIADRVRFIVGLVCGHLKSKSYGEYLGWTQGVHPSKLRYLDFRVKLPGASAAQYTVDAHDERGLHRGKALKGYFGTSWDLGFMKYGACEFCDDVFAETADIVFGDAWIEPFQRSWLGSNVILARHPTARSILTRGIKSGQLALESISPEQMSKSQASGLRHRREGLAYRLELKDRAGKWRPRKRFETGTTLSPQRQRVYEMRLSLARFTAEAFAASRGARTLFAFQARVSGQVFRYYLVVSGIKGAFTQSVIGKWIKRSINGK